MAKFCLIISVVHLEAALNRIIIQEAYAVPYVLSLNFVSENGLSNKY